MDMKYWTAITEGDIKISFRKFNRGGYSNYRMFFIRGGEIIAYAYHHPTVDEIVLGTDCVLKAKTLNQIMLFEPYNKYIFRARRKIWQKFCKLGMLEDFKPKHTNNMKGSE